MAAWSLIDLDFFKGHNTGSWVGMRNLNMEWRLHNMSESFSIFLGITVELWLWEEISLLCAEG